MRDTKLDNYRPLDKKAPVDMYYPVYLDNDNRRLVIFGVGYTEVEKEDKFILSGLMGADKWAKREGWQNTGDLYLVKENSTVNFVDTGISLFTNDTVWVMYLDN